MKFKYLTFLFLFLAACSSNAADTPDDGGDDPVDPSATPSTAAPVDATAPDILVASPSESETLSTNSATISGTLIEESEVISFTYSLNGSTEVSILDKLDSRYFFEFDISALSEGSNTIILKAADVMGNTGQTTLALTYSSEVAEEEVPETEEEDEDTLADHLIEVLASLAAWAENPEGIVQSQTIELAEGSYSFTLKNIRIRANGLDFLTDEVFPQFAKDAGLDNLPITDNLEVAHGEDGSWGCNWEWKIVATDTQIDLAIDDAFFSAEFLPDNQLSFVFDSPEAKLEKAKMKFTATAPGLCIDQETTFTVKTEDLYAKTTVTLGIDSTGSNIEIQSVDSASFKFSAAPTVEGINFWEWLGMWIKGFLDLADDQVKSTGDDEFSERFREAINDTISSAMDLSGDISDPIPIHYDATLKSFETNSNNQATSSYNIDIEIDQGKHSCARSLLAMEEVDVDDSGIPDWGDMTAQIPFYTLSKMIVMFGKTGALCQEYLIDLGIVKLSLTLNPAGTLEVQEVADGSNSILEVILPMTGTLSIYDETASTASSVYLFKTPLLINQNSFGFDLHLLASVSLDCDSGVSLNIDAATIDNLEGQVNLDGLEINVGDLDFLFSAAIDAYFDENSVYPLAPKLFGIPQVGPWAANVTEVGTDASSLYVGIEFVDEDYCGN